MAKAKKRKPAAAAAKRRIAPAYRKWRQTIKQIRAAREVPAGFATIPEALRAVERFVRARRGRQVELSRHLQVSDKSVREWLAALVWPQPARLDQIMEWYHRTSAAFSPATEDTTGRKPV